MDKRKKDGISGQTSTNCDESGRSSEIVQGGQENVTVQNGTWFAAALADPLLNAITDLFQEKKKSISKVLEQVILVLQSGIGTSETVAFRVSFDNIECQTANFSPSSNHLSVDFLVDEERGSIEIVFFHDMPLQEHDPFRLQGRAVLDYVAKTLGIYLEFRKTLQALHKSEREFKLMAKNIPAIVFKGYTDWSVDMYDDRIEQFVGYPKQAFDSRRLRWCDVLYEEDYKVTKQAFVDALKANKSYVREFRVNALDGRLVWFQERSHIVCNPAGDVEYVSGIFFDISESKRAEEELRTHQIHLEKLVERRTGELILANQQLQHDIAQRKGVEKELSEKAGELANSNAELVRLTNKLQEYSFTDDLTQIYNRRGFFRHAKQHFKTAARQGKDVAIVFVDLDGLKSINDTFGHKEGDKALIEIVDVFKKTFRETDIIARLGGDEFVILGLVEPGSNILSVTARLEKNIARQRDMMERRYNLSASMGGVCCKASDFERIEELLSCADKLMYEQKQGRKFKVTTE